MTGLFARSGRLGLASGVATAALILCCAPPACADWFGNERQVTTGAAVHDWPQLSGTRLAYADHSAERTVGAEILFDIRVLDLSTGEDLTLTPGHTGLGRPAISGNAVVWSDYGTGPDRGFWYRDLATGTQRRLAANPGSQARLDGKLMCYEFEGRIHVFNIGTGRDRVVSPAGSTASACDISGKVVVWQDRHNGGDSEIHAYNLATRSESRLTDSGTDQSLPRIDGGLVAWQGEVSPTNTDIYAYDLATGSAIRVTQDESIQWFADVDRGRVVWMDERNGHDNTEIYLQDVATGVTTRVTEHEGWSGNPTIDGDRIAYEDSRADGPHLFLRELTPPRLSVGVAAGSDPSRPEASGRLLGAAGRPIVEETVVLETSADGQHWMAADTAVTGRIGRFSFTVDAPAGGLSVRVRFAGSPEYPAATTPVLRVDGVSSAVRLRGPLP